jgi:hypothetical protein
VDARRANHLQLHLFADEPIVMFRCECGEADCRHTIPLAPNSFREHERQGTPVLYPGHTSVEDEAMAAEREQLERDLALGGETKLRAM